MAALLDAFPGDVQGRWRRIRAFISYWNGVDLDAESVPAEPQSVSSFSLALSVRHWVSLLKEVDARQGWTYCFRDALSFEAIPGHCAFSIMVQGEADYHWGVLRKDMEEEDPPVHGFRIDYDTDGWKYDRLISVRLSAFVLQHLLVYLDLGRFSAGCANIFDNVPQIWSSLAQELGEPTSINELQVYEGANWLAARLPCDEEDMIVLHARRPLGWSDLPRMLRSQNAHARARSGIFARQ